MNRHQTPPPEPLLWEHGDEQVIAHAQPLFWTAGDDNRVDCTLCYRRCSLADGERGPCGYRVNEGGRTGPARARTRLRVRA